MTLPVKTTALELPHKEFSGLAPASFS